MGHMRNTGEDMGRCLRNGCCGDMLVAEWHTCKTQEKTWGGFCVTVVVVTCWWLSGTHAKYKKKHGEVFE